MDKRLLLWIVLSLILFITYPMLMNRLFPPAKPAPATVKKPGEEKKIVEHPLPEAAEKLVTIGSMSPQSPYRLLATFNTRGAALERVEFNDPRFRELTDLSDPTLERGGYLGQLGLISEKGGARVRVVGPGTPAAEAGLQPGDLIQKLDGVAIRDAVQLTSMLDALKPKMTIALEVLRNSQPVELKVALRDVPLQLIKPEFSDGRDPLSFLMTLDRLDDEVLENKGIELGGLHLRTSSWQLLESNEDSVAFLADIEDLDLQIIKRFRLQTTAPNGDGKPSPGYGMHLEVELKNTGEKARKLAYRLDGPSGLPTEGYWYSYKLGGHGMRDVAVQQGENAVEIFTADKITTQEDPHRWVVTDTSPIKYIGVDTPYFAAIMFPEQKTGAPSQLAWARALSIGKPRTDYAYLTNSGVQLASTDRTVEPGASLVDKYLVFAGPKSDAAILPAYGLSELVQYGWFPWVVKPLIWYVDWLYSFVGNYGIAIILLTVTVRLVLMPLSWHAQYQMQGMQQKMAKIKPELDRIKEKYKGDFHAHSQAQSELFRKHDINPMASAQGCLIIFLQLPIFVGLFNALRIDIELRQAPLFSPDFFWCNDLSAPDMLWYWQHYLPSFLSSPQGGWLGPYFNLLPLISSLAMYQIQKMMMPPQQDEQMKLQQELSMKMMLVMGVFLFFKMPCGLTLYFITSTIWGVAERKLLPKPPENPDPAVLPASGPVASGPSNGKAAPIVPVSEEVRNKKARKKDRGRK